MTDRRLFPDPDRITANEASQIAMPLVDLTRGAGGSRDRQLVYGDHVTILDRAANHCLIRSGKDGYCGTVITAALGPQKEPTHKVTARSTHAYCEPSFKSADLMTLSFASRVTSLSQTATFIETALGFIPRQHLHPIDTRATDPVAIAELFLGTPYLWGGNSGGGIDCSGLVQAACLACNIPCPGDSDQQAAELGGLLGPDEPLQRNDLVFWKGHVALVCDPETLIHANAGHMLTTYEPIADALARIEQQGDGHPTARRRLPAAV